MLFDFDQDWVNREGRRLKIYQMTLLEFGQIDPNPIGNRYTLQSGCPAMDVRRAEVGYGNPASFTTYPAGQNWLAKVYKKMINQAKKEGLT